MMRCAIKEWSRRSLFLGKGQELQRKFTHRIAVERSEDSDPKAIEDGE
jgi:hypothetical protein